MLKGFRGASLVVMVAWNLASGIEVAGGATVPQPETEQVVATEMKKLYMAAAAAPPQSTAQQQVIRQMAGKASNGKELLLTMRAAVGAFPAGNGSQDHPAESQVRSMVTAKIMQVGTLEQLLEYATQYSVSPESARPFVQRMIQLGGPKTDARIWHRIRLVASRLKVPDLEREALLRADALSGK